MSISVRIKTTASTPKAIELLQLLSLKVRRSSCSMEKTVRETRALVYPHDVDVKEKDVTVTKFWLVVCFQRVMQYGAEHTL